MTTEPLLQGTHGHVRVLRLNRPEKRNPLSTDMTRALIGGLATATADPEVRVAAITGSGGSFCAGADLSPRQPSDPPPPSIEETAETVVQLLRGMRFECTKPVIAGIDGIGIGAGLSLAMAADIRVASSAAHFNQADPPPDVDAHLLDELRTVARGLMSEDGEEARRALREKRTPTFSAR